MNRSRKEQEKKKTVPTRSKVDGMRKTKVDEKWTKSRQLGISRDRNLMVEHLVKRRFYHEQTVT